MSGKAYLVGAGPGRADLITVRGLTVLRQCDAVLYDRLIVPDLLAEAPAHAERVFVGKEPEHHTLSQELICEQLVERVRAGQQVVRLKGGDPCVFGHGGEEAQYLARAGLPFEIVPGVTSAIAVPAFAGIPLTHRGLSSGFAVITGHESPDSPHLSVDWRVMAQVPTLVILMAVKRLPAICATLLEAGCDPNTPAAIISAGTTDRQQTRRATLATLGPLVAAEPVAPPAVVVIGAVAALADELAWFHPDGVASGFISSTGES